MSYGFEFFKPNGSLQFSSADKTYVLIDEFEIAAGSAGTRSYAGYSNTRVFAAAIRTEPPNPQQLCPSGTFTFGHLIMVEGNATTATVRWSVPVWFNGTGFVAVPPSTASTVYVYAI